MIQLLAASTALILSGGLGTRLRSVVADRPKVLALVAGQPYLAHLLDKLVKTGLRRVVLCTGYGADQVRAEFGARYRELDLEYSEEPEPLGTGGALRLALPQVESSTLLVLNGDSYCDADLRAFWRFHHGQPDSPLSVASSDRHRGSLLLTNVANTRRFGSVTIEAGGRIRQFREKGEATGCGWISAGIYLLDRSLVEAIPPGRAVSLERELFPTWIAGGLYGFATASAFIDIGTPESYAAADLFFGCLGHAA